MTFDRVAFLREAFQAFNRNRDAMMAGDEEAWTVLPQYFDPELEIHNIPEHPDQVEYRGYDGYRRWAKNALTDFKKVRFRPTEMYEIGPLVVVDFMAHGYGRGSGARVEQRLAGIYELLERRIRSISYFNELEQALAVARERVESLETAEA